MPSNMNFKWLSWLKWLCIVDKPFIVHVCSCVVIRNRYLFTAILMFVVFGFRDITWFAVL